jgi:hypothetical protein
VACCRNIARCWCGLVWIGRAECGVMQEHSEVLVRVYFGLDY